MKYIPSLILILITIGLASCQKENTIDKFGIFRVEEGGTSALIDGGSIKSRTLKDFEKMLETYPNINTINFQYCPGSKDDATNVLVGKAIYNKHIDTHLLDGGDIASGAVDLFLAGRTRTIGQAPKIGVHAWGGNGLDAASLAEDDPEHELYIDYFKAIGFSDQAAKDFYFFTIRAAPAEDIYWMTEEEIERFQLER